MSNSTNSTVVPTAELRLAADKEQPESSSNERVAPKGCPVVLLGRHVVPGESCNVGAIWNWKRPISVGLDSKFVAHNRPYVVDFPASWATEIKRQSRYPSGSVLPKAAADAPFARAGESLNYDPAYPDHRGGDHMGDLSHESLPPNASPAIALRHESIELHVKPRKYIMPQSL